MEPKTWLPLLGTVVTVIALAAGGVVAMIDLMVEPLRTEIGQLEREHDFVTQRFIEEFRTLRAYHQVQQAPPH